MARAMPDVAAQAQAAKSSAVLFCSTSSAESFPAAYLGLDKCFKKQSAAHCLGHTAFGSTEAERMLPCRDHPWGRTGKLEQGIEVQTLRV